MQLVSLAVIYATFAFLVEALVEHLFSDLVKRYVPNYGFVLQYLAAFTGVTLSSIYKLDIINATLGVRTEYSVAAYVFTGLVIGRGSNFVHDLFQITGARNTRVVTPVLDEDCTLATFTDFNDRLEDLEAYMHGGQAATS